MTDASNTPDVPNALPPLPEGRLQGRLLFADLVRQSLSTAAAEGWPRLVLCDPDFADWPLGERAVVASLQAWARRGRVLQLLGQDFGPLRRQHPRFVQWRVAWAHLVEVRACGSATAEEWPSAIWSPFWTLERIDKSHGVVVASRDARRQVGLAERLD
ncbi:MAG: hypothetical protein Q8M33_18290, partial [Hydrogenophaga sp.]|nr:hypothetical protein [Hydrogenophaga sp.]